MSDDVPPFDYDHHGRTAERELRREENRKAHHEQRAAFLGKREKVGEHVLSASPGSASPARDLTPADLKASIERSTLLDLAVALHPDTELTPKDRLAACALGAKVAGLVTDAATINVHVLNFKTLRPLVSTDAGERRAALEASIGARPTQPVVVVSPVPDKPST